MKVDPSKHECEAATEKQRFRTSSISDDNARVRFYTGFSALLVCLKFLGSAVDTEQIQVQKINRTQNQQKVAKESPPTFILLVRLHLGLFEQDLAHRLVYQPYPKLLTLLWPPKAMIIIF